MKPFKIMFSNISDLESSPILLSNSVIFYLEAVKKCSSFAIAMFDYYSSRLRSKDL